MVRSLYKKKMRTPFTRSQTVDENMLRYYSPETSEYSVSEGYIHRPARLAGSAKSRSAALAHLAVDRHQVDLIDDCRCHAGRLRRAFLSRCSSAPHRRRVAVGYCDDCVGSRAPRRLATTTTTSTTTLTRTKTATTTTLTTTSTTMTATTERTTVAKGPFDIPDHLDNIRSIDASLHPRRSLLSAKARSFDYDVMHDTYGDRFGTRPGAVGLLSRRAKSFEYESISSNIFSDDSLRTARRKLKRNLSLSDAGYGDKIPALGDQSKSYYDSNGDDKVPTTAAAAATTTATTAASLACKETTNYDYLLERVDHKPAAFYGYDSELSCGETEIYVPGFEQQSIEATRGGVVGERIDKPSSYGSRLADDSNDAGLFAASDGRASLRNILDKEDTGKRKYADGSYLDSSYRDISSEKRTKSLELRNSINDHIYCSIEDALSSGGSYERDLLARSATRLHDAAGLDEWMSAKGVSDVLRSHGATTTTTGGRAYQGDGYKSYEDWDTDYDEGFVEREKIEDFDYRDEGIEALRSASSMYEDEYRDDLERARPSVARDKSGKRYAQPDDDDDDDLRVTASGDYISYRPAEDYDYRVTTHGSSSKAETYEDGPAPARRRRRRSRRGSREGGDDSPAKNAVRASLESKRLTTTMVQQHQQRTTPALLHSDEDLSADRSRRVYRRRRNSSCPESRDLRIRDGPTARRGDDERTAASHFVLDSDEEFGSMETVVGTDYFRRTGYATTETTTRATDAAAVRPSSFSHAAQDRGSYLDARYDYHEGYQDRTYPEPRELVRSGSQRSSSCSREPRHASSTRARRKSSCPECRELAWSSSELVGGRSSGSLSRTKVDNDRRTFVETRHRYRRRNSSCPEARDLEMFERRQRQQLYQPRHQQQQPQQQRRPSQQQQMPQPQPPPPPPPRSQLHSQPHQQQGSKRNVAISDTLEYYEYSMESESQCSENCGFGPCDPRRPRNRAPRPGNANSSLFDSQTATSDTAKNYHPRADGHHQHHHPQNTKTSPLADVASAFLPSGAAARRRSRKKSAVDADAVAAAAGRRDDDDDARNARRSSSMPESSEYSGQSSSYEKTSRHQVTDNGHDEHGKRNQFTRSLSNADVPQDEKGETERRREREGERKACLIARLTLLSITVVLYITLM